MGRPPPSPAGCPVIGNAHQYSKNPLRFLTACSQVYGDVVAADFGGQQAYIVTEPDLIENVLVDNQSEYTKAQSRDNSVERLLGTGLLLSEGPVWRERRSLLRAAFDADRIIRLSDSITRQTEVVLNEWDAGDTRDLHRDLPRLTLRVILEIMFGVPPSDALTDRIQAALSPLITRFEPDFKRLVIPGWVPRHENEIFRKSIRELNEVIDLIITDRLSNPSGNDIVSILLREYENSEREFGWRELRDELVTILLAGHDTTALALIYAWYLLAYNPDADKMLNDELTRVLDGETPTYEDLESLDFTQRILKESIRLYPPVYSLFRQTIDDTPLGEIVIPEGSVVFMPQWVVHRDARWFNDPDRFDPHRWDQTQDSSRPSFAYFPFGGGPRSCIGKQLSLIEGSLILASISQQYRLERVTETPLNLRCSLTLHPDGPVDMELISR